MTTRIGTLLESFLSEKAGNIDQLGLPSSFVKWLFSHGGDKIGQKSGIIPAGTDDTKKATSLEKALKAPGNIGGIIYADGEPAFGIISDKGKYYLRGGPFGGSVATDKIYGTLTKMLKDLRDNNQKPSLKLITGDQERVAKQKGRSQARRGSVPLPGDREYRNYIRDLRRDLSGRLEKFKLDKMDKVNSIKDLKKMANQIVYGDQRVAYDLGSQSTAAFNQLFDGKPLMFEYRRKGGFSFIDDMIKKAGDAPEPGPAEYKELYRKMSDMYPDRFHVIVKMAPDGRLKITDTKSSADLKAMDTTAWDWGRKMGVDV